MAKELVRRTTAVATRPGGALKKAAKKSPGKKAAKKSPGKKAAKKAPGKKAPGKKSAKHTPDHKLLGQGTGPDYDRAFHHLQRAAAVISLLEQESGGDLRMLLEEGIKLYRSATPETIAEPLNLLRAAEHLALAGLYAARISHRLDVAPPPSGELERLLRKAAHHLELPDLEGFKARLPAMSEELLNRAEAALDHDPHLAWELTMAADALCTALEA